MYAHIRLTTFHFLYTIRICRSVSITHSMANEHGIVSVDQLASTAVNEGNSSCLVIFVSQNPQLDYCILSQNECWDKYDK